MALTQGKALATIAGDLNVSRTTIAFHMRNLFQKTGTRRQAGLVAYLHKAARTDGSAKVGRG